MLSSDIQRGLPIETPSDPTNPPHLVWDEAVYGTGVPEVDAQHRALFDRLNALLTASRGGQGRLEVGEFFQFLAAYAAQHFRSEEQVMDCRGCRARGINRAAHATFRDQLTAIRNEFDRVGATEEVANRIEVHLCDWFRNHIAQVDVKLKDTAAPTGA